MRCCSKTHFEAFKKYDSLSHISRNSCTICLCRDGSSSVAMRTSSIYTKSSLGYLSMSPLRMRLMVLAKVAGAFVRPNVMTLGMNNPLGVLNAAFHWSSSLMRILWYPHRMSNFENKVLPPRLVRLLDMRGRG